MGAIGNEVQPLRFVVRIDADREQQTFRFWFVPGFRELLIERQGTEAREVRKGPCRSEPVRHHDPLAKTFDTCRILRPRERVLEVAGIVSGSVPGDYEGTCSRTRTFIFSS